MKVNAEKTESTTGWLPVVLCRFDKKNSGIITLGSVNERFSLGRVTAGEHCGCYIIFTGHAHVVINAAENEAVVSKRDIIAFVTPSDDEVETPYVDYKVGEEPWIGAFQS